MRTTTIYFFLLLCVYTYCHLTNSFNKQNFRFGGLTLRGKISILLQPLQPNPPYGHLVRENILFPSKSAVN